MNFKDIADQRIAVNCQTEKDAREFVKMAYENGYNWRWKPCLSINTYFDKYTHNTCYAIMGGNLEYADLFGLKYLNYKIIKFSDFIKEDSTMENNLGYKRFGLSVRDFGTETLEVSDNPVISWWFRTLSSSGKLPSLYEAVKFLSEYFATSTLPPSPPNFISDIEVKNDTVVIMKFADGTTEKAVTSPEDTFSLEQGIMICLMKKLLSLLTDGNGSSAYNKILHKAIKFYNNKQEAIAKKDESDRLEKERAEKRAAKRAKRKAKYEAKKKEREVSIQAEAYARALRMVKQDENV